MENSSVFGFYKTKNQAHTALKNLERLGVRKTDIKVMYPDYPHKEFTKKEMQTIKIRTLIGAVIGLSFFAAISVLILLEFVPKSMMPSEKNDVDVFFAVNGLLAGILTGALIGAMIGALSGLSSLKKTPPHFSKEASTGDIILSVHLDELQDENKIKELLKKTGAGDINSTKKSDEWETKILPLT